MDFQILYEDKNLLAVNKPAPIVVFSENKTKEKTLIDLIIEKNPQIKEVGNPPRYGIVHRLDKETSGILLVAKKEKALHFFQKQFKKGEVLKKYLALAVGRIPGEKGRIESLIGRNPGNRTKQKAYPLFAPGTKGKRVAITYYKTTKKFKDYTLLEIIPKTGRKHQIRVHLSYIGHPIAGDKKYGFRNQPCPSGLERQFLHAYFLKIKLENEKEIELKSELPKDLKKILKELKN